MKTIIALSLLLVAPVAFAKKENFKVSVDDTKISWEGQKSVKALGGHHGSLKAKSGTLQVDGEKLVGGEVVIDMKSLKDEDLTDESMNKKLVTHLNSDDFFSTEKHPTATLKIAKVEHEKEDSYLISGDLTIKGIKKPIKPFSAKIHAGKDMVHSMGTMAVDRTLYNIKYNSLKFFSSIGDKAIADTFTVTFEILAKK
jgi:polyisoprenoid-binding protein YceI